MQPISKLRFEALAGYARQPQTVVYSEELAWFEHGGERVLGIVIRDRTDGDYSGVVFGRDERLRYRWTGMTGFVSSERRAKALLRPAMEQAAMAADEEHHQGDGHGAPADFFTPVVATERLNANFSGLVDLEGFSPARGIIEPMMRWYDDVDGNFVEQFQTTAFDARMWELYLFATFVEAGLALDRTKATPDFITWGLAGQAAIEAVTVNPTRDKRGAVVPPPEPETEEERWAFLREYMPIKFGSALYSKLTKEYWAKPHVRGLPFALAIQDFSSPGSMVFTRSALQVYLYGFDHDWRHEADGTLVIEPRRVERHCWGEKEIPSGFFFLPGSENVSAVIFSNSGTVSKFNRMGMIAGFGSPRVQMIRQGMAINLDPNASAPTPFRHQVNDPAYRETWVEGLDVFHNPRALIPFPRELLPGAAHLRLADDGRILATVPDWHPLGSRTLITVPDDSQPARA